MEGVLYKWTNYLSGECRPLRVRCARRRRRPASGPDREWGTREAGSPGRLRGPPQSRELGAGGGLAWAAAQLQGAECQQPLDSRVSTQTLTLGTFRVIPLQTEVMGL